MRFCKSRGLIFTQQEHIWKDSWRFVQKAPLHGWTPDVVGVLGGPAGWRRASSLALGAEYRIALVQTGTSSPGGQCFYLQGNRCELLPQGPFQPLLSSVSNKPVKSILAVVGEW